MALIELIEGAAPLEVTGDEDEATTKRRRLSRPGRRKAAADLPQDKPARSRAAQASAEGTPAPGGDIEHPPGVSEDGIDAEEAAAEGSAEAADEAAVENVAADPTDQVGQADTGDAGEQGRR